MVEVGGVRTLFRMPDLLSIGLGGGTAISADDAGDRAGQRRLPATSEALPGPIASVSAEISVPPPRPIDSRSGMRNSAAHAADLDRVVGLARKAPPCR